MAKSQRQAHTHDWIPYVSDEGGWSDRCFECGVVRSRAAGTHAPRPAHRHRWVAYALAEGGELQACADCAAERLLPAGRSGAADRAQVPADQWALSAGVASAVHVMFDVLHDPLGLTSRPQVVVAWVAAVAALVAGVLMGAGLGLLIWTAGLPSMP